MLLGAAPFCVAGAALGEPQVRFAWQVYTDWKLHECNFVVFRSVTHLHPLCALDLLQREIARTIL